MWSGAQLADNNRWICQLDDAQIAAIDEGIETFTKAGLPWQSASASNLTLKGLDELITRIRDELEEGSGLFRLSGVPVERYSLDQIKSFYLALGSHIGTPGIAIPRRPAPDAHRRSG